MTTTSSGGATATPATGPKPGVLDRLAQRHPWLDLPIAVVRKFVADGSTNLAGMIAFWAFFSLFPLLLVFVTVLGYALPDSIKGRVLDNVAAMLPLLDASTLHGLTGAWWALLLGSVTALWSGLSVVRTIESAFNTVWRIPPDRQPSLGTQVLRGLAALATVGLGLVVSTVLSGLIASAASWVHLGWGGRLVGYLIAIALDIGLFTAGFRMLTHRAITTRDVLPGALLSGLVFWVLQSASGLVISRYLQHAQHTYGQFAVVITILWWFYLQSLVTLLGAQLNAVRRRRATGEPPRDPPDDPPADADRNPAQDTPVTAPQDRIAAANAAPRSR